MPQIEFHYLKRLVACGNFQIGLAFPKEDSLYNGIYAGADKLGWTVTPVRSDIVASGKWNETDYDPSTFDLLFLDYRQPKLLPQNTLSIIR